MCPLLPVILGRDLSRSSAAKTIHYMQYATDIKLHVHTYAVGAADIVAREGSPPQYVAFV